MSNSRQVNNETIITLEELKKIEFTDNIMLKQCKSTNFFIPGEGGIVQFTKDFVQRKMKFMGRNHLGFDAVVAETVSPEQIRMVVETEFPNRSDSIFKAISQFATAIVPYGISHGLSGDIMEQTHTVKQANDEDSSIDLKRDPHNQDQIIIVCKFTKFPVFNTQEKQPSGYLSGAEMTLKLKQNSPTEFGFEVVNIKTADPTIIRIFKGEMVSVITVFDEQLKSSKEIKVVEGDRQPYMFAPKMIQDKLRFGNSDAKVQVDRDVRMISGAIEKHANSLAPSVLQKLYTILYYGELNFKRNNKWHLWRQNDMPIASVLCHGSRTLIQFPAEMSNDIMFWLLGKDHNPYVRTTSSHGIEESKDVVEFQDGSKKILAESKYNAISATVSAVRKNAFDLYNAVGSFISLPPAPQTKLKHYGINLALGGEGELNEVSSMEITANGEHGHLYMLYSYPDQDKENADHRAGLLIGIEQSAPLSSDQYGGTHSVTATHLGYTATGGDDFGSRPEHVPEGYKGISDLGPDEYYDSLCVDLSRDKFEKIKQYAEKFELEILNKPGQSIQNKEAQEEKDRQAAARAEEEARRLAEEEVRRLAEEARQLEEVARRLEEEEARRQAEQAVRQLEEEARRLEEIRRLEDDDDDADDDEARRPAEEVESSATVEEEVNKQTQESGFKSFLKRHKVKIIVGGIALGVIVGGLLTGGILSLFGVIAGVGILATIAAGISGGVAAALGVEATVATAVAGAVIVTAGATTVGCTSGMVIGKISDAAKSNHQNNDIESGIPQKPANMKNQTRSCMDRISIFKCASNNRQNTNEYADHRPANGP